MTREEAIKQLKKLKSFHNGSYGEAINFAIESIKVDLAYDLEYEKAENYCEDCISRQAVIDALGECPMNWTDSDAEITAERDWLDTVKMLKSLPSVNPQEPYKDFCEFVAKMVLRDDFEENAGANAEFLCRKLSKLGMVKADEDKWVLVESEDE